VEELKQIAATKPGIKLIKKLGRADATWIKNHVTYTDKTLWYLCGNPDMVLNFVQTLSNTLKISECNFYTEEYPGYRAMQTEYKIWPPIEEEVVILSEEALLEESFIRALLQATGQGALISITDLQGKIIYANDKFVQVSKYSREELLGENHRILKSGIHPPEIYADMWKTISSNHLWRGEIKNRAKDGSFYWVDASILSVTFRGGMRRYLAVRYLITDKKMLEVSEKELLATLNQLQSMSREKDFLKALHQSEEKFRSFVETTNSWVWEMDIFGKYTYSNPTSQKILGYDLKELLGKEIFALAVEAEKIKKEMGDCICLQKGWSDRLWQVKSRGGSSLWLESSGNPILNEKGTLIGFRGTDHDVTDRIRIDQLKNEFISMVSHELRTPLTSIVGALGVIGAKKDLSTELDDLISIASRNADRLVHIINDILDIERIQLGKLELKLELLFLDRLVQETINLSRPMAIANQITLVEEKIFPSVRIMADSNRLAQVMFNLLSNAIKFSHPGGKVTVRMESRGEIIRVAVEDLGKGIPAEMQKKIFEKFSQIEGGDIHVKGTGLGLNISKSLVEQMGGKIGFNSAANLGSTFYFEFPIVKDG
jgi:PAS domain S-box-containing protein